MKFYAPLTVQLSCIVLGAFLIQNGAFNTPYLPAVGAYFQNFGRRKGMNIL